MEIFKSQNLSILTLVAFFSLSSCAKYAIKNDELSASYVKSVTFPLHFNQTRSAILDLLSQRGQKFKEHIKRNGSSIDIEMEWIRDSSLSYFYLQRGQRVPHLVHWKGVWKIYKVTNFQTNVGLDMMELAYLGPQEKAPAAPRIDGQWAESKDNNLRAALEIRRLWTSTIPHQDLPPALGQIQVPDLNFPPLSLKEHREAKIHRASRPTAF